MAITLINPSYMIQDEPTHEIYVVPELYRSKTVSANNDLFEGKWLHACPRSEKKICAIMCPILRKENKGILITMFIQSSHYLYI